MMRRRDLLFTLPLLTPLSALAATGDRAASRAYLLTLRNADGGFRATPLQNPSTLSATVAISRGVHHWGGELPDREASARFVWSCFHSVAGGFSDTAQGDPEVRATALGLMALAELHAPLGERGRAAIHYLNENAVTLPDLYFAAAAMEATGRRFAAAGRVRLAYEAILNHHGSYGANAYDTAGAAVSLLRVGVAPSSRKAVIRTLRHAQEEDGGFRGTGKSSDLSGCYRIVRAFAMLHAAPDVSRLRRFLARCRNADGGYGLAPGQPSAGPPTYYASIILHWLDELEGV